MNVRAGAVLTLAVWLVIATGVIVWLGYRATREWQRLTLQSAERRASEVLALLAVALDRDMKGAQTSVLLPLNQRSLTLDPPYDLADRFARAFARFPYPESFFAWRDDPDRTGARPAYFFNRSDRPPTWHVVDRSRDPYPVVILADPPAVMPLIAEARRLAAYGTRFALFESDVAGLRYQTVVHLIYRDDLPRPALFGLVGFTVNLDWVSREYFLHLIQEVRRVGGPGDAVHLSIADDAGRAIVPAAETAPGPLRERRFPLVFFDRTLFSSLPPDRAPVRMWTARASTADSALLAAGRGAERALILMALAALVTIVALVVTVGAVRASTALATMKSDFVSTVTHELKTPLAFIRLVGDTLAKGRYTSQAKVAEYAKLLSHEATRLTRLIDNLLTEARLADAERGYAFGPVELLDLVEELLEHFEPQLRELGFEVKVDIDTGLPPVRADRTALGRALENLLDNAIKYSEERRVICLRAAAANGRLRLDVIDQGSGIAPEDVPRVFDRFFRGRHTKQGGSGLGLAIVRRIVRDHGGEVHIRSVVGQGTSIAVELPVSGAA